MFLVPGTVRQISHGARNESSRVQFFGKRSDVERQNSFYCDWKNSRITPQGRQFDTRQSSKKFVELSNSQIHKSKNSEKVQPSQVLLQV